MRQTNRRQFIIATGKWMALGWMAPTLWVGCQGLEEASQVGAALGTASGVLTQQQADSLVKSGTAVARSFRDITPEQEYYIGRTVSAQIMSQYRPYKDAAATRYITTLGQALARVSDLPETFNGYHFLILDSDQINAFAAPSGYIFVTRGMLRCCRSEDALAAVLAHEIGHVQNRHGLQAIKKQRVTQALSVLALEGAKTFGGEELAELTTTFEGAISDITLTLTNSGYSREFESQADTAAVTILRRIGYSPNALVDMLVQMNRRLKPGGIDFARTHPDPQDRIADIRQTGVVSGTVNTPNARHARFRKFMKVV